MFKVLTQEDIALITKFLKKLNKFNDEMIKNIHNNIDKDKIILANLNSDVSSMIIVNLINNNYYIGNILFLKSNIDELKELLGFTIEVLKHDNRGLDIIYDNFPYNEVLNEIFINNDFKCNFINYMRETLPNQVFRVKSNITINDKSLDVREYLYNHYIEVLKENNAYMNNNDIVNSAIDDVHLDNTNIVVARDNEGSILGVARFSLITDSIFINSLYANSEEIYIDLINLIANLTNRRLEIGLYPIRKDLANILKKLGFYINQADYLFNIN